MERKGSDTRAYHSLTTSFVWDVPNVTPGQTRFRYALKYEEE